jgi:TPR repeat protein
MKRTNTLLIILALLAPALAVAQWSEFPTGDLDSRTMRTQAKVESLYERGDYKRAHFIYSNELAREGDKYAQYMTGYMYMMGQGVEEDPVKASAWYRIAAERRAPEFMAVRDQVLQNLNDEQRARSDELYVELRKEYSDLVIIMELLVEDLDNLKIARTGSRLSGNASSVMIIDPKTGMPVSSDHLRNRDLRTAQMRLDFVTSRLDIDPIKAEQVDEQIDMLWQRVRDYLSVVDDEAGGFYAAP